MAHDETPILDGALATLFLFAAHHAYGALHYETPWRMHGALLALPLGLLLWWSSRAARLGSGTPAGEAARVTFLSLVVVTCILGVGLFEGLYNHVLKNVLFLGGAAPALLGRLFPPPLYELPDDLWFELSGVLQVLPAAWTARAVLGMARPAAREARS